MAKYFPAAVRPSTSGMPSSMAFAMRLPPTSDARSAGYQSSYSSVAVGPEAATCARVTSPIMREVHTIAEPASRPVAFSRYLLVRSFAHFSCGAAERFGYDGGRVPLSFWRRMEIAPATAFRRDDQVARLHGTR